MILCIVSSWNLHQKYFLKEVLFSDVISFDPCIFHNSRIISADISRNWKVEKLLVAFFKSTYLWKKILISRYDMITFTYKSWFINSGWLTIFVRSEVTWGDSFDFKMLLTIFSLKSIVFNKYFVDFFKK